MSMVLLADWTGAVGISDDKPIGFCSEGQAFVCCLEFCVNKAARVGWGLVVSVRQLFGNTCIMADSI